MGWLEVSGCRLLTVLSLDEFILFVFSEKKKKDEASAETSSDEESDDDEEEDLIGEKGKAPNNLLMEVMYNLLYLYKYMYLCVLNKYWIYLLFDENLIYKQIHE